MYKQCVVGVFDKLSSARSTIESLEAAGFLQEDVSLVTRSVEDQMENPSMLEYGDKSAERSVKGAGVGGLVGLLLGSPLLMVPGIGPILLAGPIATGGIVGGLLGAMAGWGVDPGNLEAYEKQVREGAVLVIVQGPPDRVAQAQEIFRGSSAVEVHLHAKTSADSPEIDDRGE